MTLTNNQTRKWVTLGVLSALGAVLMILEIPYPLVGFLTIDLSDVVVLIVFAMFGWKEAAIVGVLKAVVHILFKGPVMGGIAIPIGQITAFLASMSYVLGMYIGTDKLNLNKYLSAGVSILVVTLIMTVANYLFITPIWFGFWWYSQIPFPVTPQAFELSQTGGYLYTILLVYVPFNIIKAAIITGVFIFIYEVLKIAVISDQE